MENSKSFLPWSLRLIISILFIVSAIAKLYPSPYFAISTFEVKQLYSLGFNELTAPWFSRILIGIEFALGILILQNHYLKKIIIPATIALLAVFVIHLSYVTFLTGGNSGNCGCFGELIPMTPIEAIIKNIVAILILLFLRLILPTYTKTKHNFWIVTFITIACIIGLFILAPIKNTSSNFDVVTPYNLTPQKDSTFIQEIVPTIKDTVAKDTLSVDTKKLLEEDTIEKVIEQNEPPKVKSGYAKIFPTIDNGRKTLCFFVPGCDHCREAAKDLTELKRKNKDFPEILVIFMNEEADLIPDFFKAAGASYPYKIIEIIPFWNILGSGNDTPGVKYLWNGNTYKYYTGINENKFDPKDYEKLIQKPFSKLKTIKN